MLVAISKTRSTRQHQGTSSCSKRARPLLVLSLSPTKQAPAGSISDPRLMRTFLLPAPASIHPRRLSCQRSRSLLTRAGPSRLLQEPTTTASLASSLGPPAPRPMVFSSLAGGLNRTRPLCPITSWWIAVTSMAWQANKRDGA